jgi:hypothetical protein
MEGISACLMAHINTAGVHVPIWLDASDPAIGWGVDRVNYPMQEGSFFGDIIDTGALNNIGKPMVSGPVAYYCDGAGFPAGASGVVAGRLGANQTGAPYKNPFGSGALCQSVSTSVGYFSRGVAASCPVGSTSNPSQGCPDGYQQLAYPSANPWTHGITVWRNNNYTPVFDTTYRYTFSPSNTAGAMVVDTGTSPVQQWSKATGLPSSVFAMAANGSNWTMSPNGSPGRCLDAGAGTNGTGIVVSACNSGAQQSWTITPDIQTGNFFFKASSTGRCMNVRAGSTAAGAAMEVDDCNPASPSQKFAVQAM